MGRAEKEGHAEKVLEEVVAKNFPKLEKYIYLQIWETEQTPSKINTKKVHYNIPHSNFWTLKTKK